MFYTVRAYRPCTFPEAVFLFEGRREIGIVAFLILYRPTQAVKMATIVGTSYNPPTRYSRADGIVCFAPALQKWNNNVKGSYRHYIL